MSEMPEIGGLSREQRAVRVGASAPTPARRRAAVTSTAKVHPLRRHSFLLAVLAPTLLAFIYFQFLATRQYLTEFQFTILPLSVAGSSSSGGSSGSDSSGATAGQSPVVGSSSSGGSSALLSVMDNMVVSYIGSQQAVIDVRKRIDLRAMFDNKNVDPLQRFWWSNGSFERLTDYWKLFVVNASFDVTTGLCDVRIKAFTPTDSGKIAQTLVQLSEQLINNQSLRQRHDTIAYAETEFRSAQVRLNKALAAETAFRASHESIDPSLNGTANENLTATLQQSLTALLSQRDSVQKVSPNAPQLQILNSQIQAARQQLAKVSSNIGSGDMTAGAGKARVPISTAMAGFEALEAEKGFATQNYTANLANLTSANFAAVQQQFYLEPYIEPVTPQFPSYPQPFVATALVFVTTLALWGIWTLFYGEARRG